ncbi:MAG: hypothetical protein ACI9LY_000831 [Arenicella sp.]
MGGKWNDLNLEASSVNFFQKGGSYRLLTVTGNLLWKMLEYKSIYAPASDYVFSPARNNSTKSLNKLLNTSYIYQLVQRAVSKVGSGKRAHLIHFEKPSFSRNDAIVIAYAGGDYTLKEIGDCFGLHYNRVSSIVKNHKSKT